MTNAARLFAVKFLLPTALALSFLPATVQACSVPVFRYALLWWGARSPLECYQVIVFHRGDFDSVQQRQIEALAAGAWSASDGGNYTVRLLDLSTELGTDAQTLWDAQQDPTEPWMIIRYPQPLQIEQLVWAGPFSETAVAQLLDSPLRRDLTQRILNGDSAVWVLLESGDQVKDEAAAKCVLDEIARLQSELRLPTEADDPIDNPEDRALEAAAEQPGLPPLRLSFSLVRLSRDDPDEQFLVRMLLHSEPDLSTQYNDQPMAFPVFGRGRTLWGLIGGGINPELIADACRYVTGMCSCQIKAQNPGFDLLLNLAWDKLLFEQDNSIESQVAAIAARLPAVIEAPLPVKAVAEEPEGHPAGGTTEVATQDAPPAAAAKSTDSSRPVPTAMTTDAERPGPSRLARNLVIAIGVSVVLTGLLGWLVSRRSVSS